MSQIAKLHIRGSLVNATSRNLTPTQKLEAERVARDAFTDNGVEAFCTKTADEALAKACSSGKAPNNPAAYHRKVYKETFKNSSLGAARTEFCAALGRTIGSEYKDVEAALIEAQISFWMTSVDVLFHRPKKHIIKLLNCTCSDCLETCMVDDKPIRSCPKCNSTNRLKAPKDLIMKSTDEVEAIYTEMTGAPPPERDTSIIRNPIQRKKFFQTCLFNYLRQILRENTYPKASAITTMRDYADKVVLQMVKSDLSKSDSCTKMAAQADVANRRITIKLKETDKTEWHSGDGLCEECKIAKNLSLCTTCGGTTIAAGADSPLSIEDIDKLFAIKTYAEKYGVSVTWDDSNVTISCIAESIPVISASVLEKTRMHQISLDGPRNSSDDDGGSFREHIESQNSDDAIAQAFSHHDVDLRDCAEVVINRLGDNARKIVEVITNTPPEYIQKFGDRICKAHIAEFLGLSPKEVQRQWDIIALQMRAVDLVP